LVAYVTRRLLLLIPMAIGMVVVTFGLLLLVPGDPAAVLLGPEASPEMIQNLRQSLGLDDPWYVRLGGYFWQLLHGDMGRSIFQSAPVSEIIAGRIGATIELAVVALLLSTLIGVTLGVVAAIRQGSIVDTVSMLLAQLGVSMPVYWLGVLLAGALAGTPGWPPPSRRGAPRPAALRAAASRTAYAKGLRRNRVVVRHALRNALLPVLSVIGLRFGALLGGAVLVEMIFAWPGLGQLTFSAVSQRDLPLIQGIVLTFALIFALVNLVVDLLYAAVDPRIRLG